MQSVGFGGGGGTALPARRRRARPRQNIFEGGGGGATLPAVPSAWLRCLCSTAPAWGLLLRPWPHSLARGAPAPQAGSWPGPGRCSRAACPSGGKRGAAAAAATHFVHAPMFTARLACAVCARACIFLALNLMPKWCDSACGRLLPQGSSFDQAAPACAGRMGFCCKTCGGCYLEHRV